MFEWLVIIPKREDERNFVVNRIYYMMRLVHNRKGLILNNAVNDEKSVRIYREVSNCEFKEKNYNYLVCMIYSKKGRLYRR